MAEKVDCISCGIDILAVTAKVTGGLCMPCKQGGRMVKEDFELVKFSNQRGEFLDEINKNLLLRYKSGEYADVWNEIHQLDLRKDCSYSYHEIYETVSETFKKVAYNLEHIYTGLSKLGYQFQFPEEAFVLADESDKQAIAELEELVGVIPLTLKCFYENIRSVNFCQSWDQLVQWHEREDQEVDQLLYLGEEDPLSFISAKALIEEVKDISKNHHRNINDEAGSAKLYCWVANDEFHKANYSGGENYHIHLPEVQIDFPILSMCTDEEDTNVTTLFGVDEDFGPNEFFVTYLRNICKGAGFRGRLDMDTYKKNPPNFDFLNDIKSKLIKF